MITPFKKAMFPAIIGLGKRKVSGIFSDEPVLIGGCGRSGTTLLLSILSAHPNIFASRKELSLFESWIKDKNGKYGPERIDRLYLTFLRNHIPRSVTRWCEKTPNNIRFIDRIDQYFNGKFKFIHIIRDGRDVITSKHPSSDGQYYVNPERWINDVSIGLTYKEHPNVLTIKYEELVVNFQSTIEEVCRHLNIDCTPRIFEWYRYSTVRRNPAYFSGLEKMHSNSIGKWKNEEHKARVNQLLSHQKARELLTDLRYL